MLAGSSVWTRVAILAVVGALQSCAPPAADKITAFSNSASALSQLAKTIGDVNIQTNDKLTVADAALRYAANQSCIKNGSDSFPPPMAKLGVGTDANWKSITGFFDALSAYAGALGAVSDAKLQSGLSSGFGNLSSAIAKADTARALATAAKAAEKTAITARQTREAAINGIAADLAGAAVQLYTTSQIIDTMAQTQKILDDAKPYLKAGLTFVQNDTKIRLQFLKQCIITRKDMYAANSTVSVPERYDMYVSAVADYRNLEEQSAALKDVNRAIDKLVDAHRQLWQREGGDATSLGQFVTLVGDIADKLVKAKPN